MFQGGQLLFRNGLLAMHPRCCCNPCVCSECPYLQELWDATTALLWDATICGVGRDGTLAASAGDGCIAWEGLIGPLEAGEFVLVQIYCDETGLHVNSEMLSEGNCELLDLAVTAVDCGEDYVSITLEGTVTERPGLPIPGACVCDGTPVVITISSP